MLRLALLCSLCFLFLNPYSVKAETTFSHLHSTTVTKVSHLKSRSVSSYRPDVFYASGHPTDDSLYKANKALKRSKWSKWLGIGSLVSLLTPLGILALPAAIVAVVMGKNVKVDTKDQQSLKNSNTGIITGFVTIGLFVLAVLVLVALIAALSGWR
jgi:hypothetical protein